MNNYEAKYIISVCNSLIITADMNSKFGDYPDYHCMDILSSFISNIMDIKIGGSFFLSYLIHREQEIYDLKVKINNIDCIQGKAEYFKQWLKDMYKKYYIPTKMPQIRGYKLVES